MTFKIAIIDDEIHIRNSIRKKIDLPEFEVVFDTDNGEALIDYLKTNGPRSLDLILVDIVMPLMNGLDLICEIKGIRPDIPIIILSGFNMFEYAQKAIKLGVEDYLLKPVIPQELNATLTKLLEKLKFKHGMQIKSCVDSLSHYVASKGKSEIEADSLAVFKEHFNNGFVIQMCLNGNWESSCSWFGMYDVNNWSFIYPGISNLLVSFIHDEAEKPYDGIDWPTITTFLSARQFCQDNLIGCIEEGFKTIKQNLTLGRHICINKNSTSCGMASRCTQWELRAYEDISIISRFLENKEYGKVVKRVEELFTYSDIAQIHFEKVWKVIAEKIFGYFPEKRDIVDESWIRVCDDIEYFREEIIEILNEVFRLDSSESKSKAVKDIVKDITKYLNTNYAENITLKDIADKYYINKSHLARVFKQETNKTVNEYLTEVRVNKACELINQAKNNVKEISYLVGYEDSRYFSQVFQKITGCSPSKYKNIQNSK